MRRLASWLAIVILAGACLRSAEEPKNLKDGKDTQDDKSGVEVKAEGVEVTPADRERLGIAVEELRPAERQGQTEGFATVVSVAALGEVDSDLAAARVAAVASRAALARAEALYADQVSVSLAAVEAARRQAAADDAQVQRLERRLALEWGPRAAGSPFAGEGSRRAWLDRLAAGQAALARVQFPLGTVLPSRTPTLHLEALTAAGPRTAAAPAVRAIWPAPEDPALPGPAFFALITGGALPQIGERLRATADLSHVQQGVTIPESAVVLSGGSAWCFVKIGDDGPSGAKTSRFVRRPVALPEGAGPSEGSPESAAGGYFAASGFAAGEKVVVQGAGLLLAHEVGATAGGEEE